MKQGAARLFITEEVDPSSEVGAKSARAYSL